MQKDVDFATPAKDAIEQCTIKPEKFNNQSAWVVRDKTGQILRRFVDTNADNVVDQWCYYQDGLEVYRDVDADFNGKPDQCRWFNTAGTRWGLDTNEDGKVDRWKEISAEEASDELVHALGDKDPARFARLLLTAEELKALGFGETRTEELKTKITSAPNCFISSWPARRLSATTPAGCNSAARAPGIMLAGTDGSTKDVTIYDNAVVVAESGGKHVQLQLGTLVLRRRYMAFDRPSANRGRRRTERGGRHARPRAYGGSGR